MKTKFTFTLGLLLCALASIAQNQITTPAGQPLVIGNQGVKLSNLNSGSATQPTNGKVLSVDANGLIFLAPDASGVPSQFTNNGANIYFNTGNVGLGTDNPQQRLDVNGSINIPTGSGLRINNSSFLSAPGTDNVFLGISAGAANTTGIDNLFLGSKAGVLNTAGFSNLFIGTSSGRNNTSGERNIFMGAVTGASNTTGSRNTFVGESAGYNNTSGTDNTFVGRESGISNIGGSYNLYIGRATGIGVPSGSGNTFIGDNATSNVSTTSYSTAIGDGARVDCDYCMVLGRVAPQVKVGIGTKIPLATFHVKSGGSIATGVRLESLPTATGSVFPLFVDADGNVMRSSTAGAREASESLDLHWTLTADNHLINNNPGGIMIGSGFKSTPQGYKLFVEEGILTERVKVAIKNTDDWSDKVFSPNYVLRPLSEVAAFIAKNKHLPDVPSADEVVEKGVDLGKMDALLLQKVEELTLYMLELKKENEQLRKDIEALKK